MIDDQTILALLNHPLRREILKHSVERGKPLSPNQIAKELGERLNGVSYHVRVLNRAGALILVDEQPARGSLQHFYVHDKELLAVAWVRQALGLPTTS